MLQQTATEICEIKAKVRERDNNHCRLCGTPGRIYEALTGKSLDVHRKDPGSLYTAEGCVTLCVVCHNKQPHSESKKYKPEKRCSIVISAEIAWKIKAIGLWSGHPAFGVGSILEDIIEAEYDKVTSFQERVQAKIDAKKSRQYGPRKKKGQACQDHQLPPIDSETT